MLKRFSMLQTFAEELVSAKVSKPVMKQILTRVVQAEIDHKVAAYEERLKLQASEVLYHLDSFVEYETSDQLV